MPEEVENLISLDAPTGQIMPRQISEEEAIKLTLESTDIDIEEGMELGQLLVAQVGKTNEVRRLASAYVDRLNEMEKKLQELRDTNSRLLQENLGFKSDSLFASYFALNRKNNEMADSLNSFTLELTKDKDDKTFERFKVLISMLPDMTKTISSLRNDYLRIGDEEAKEIEKKGIPLIEQKRITGSGKGKSEMMKAKPEMVKIKPSASKTNQSVGNAIEQVKPRPARQNYEL